MAKKTAYVSPGVGGALFSLFGILGYTLVLVRRDILPARFFYDSDRIQRLAETGFDATNDPSYGAISNLYNILGLVDHETIVGLINFSLYLVVVVLVIKRAAPPSGLSRSNWIYLGVISLLGAIFLGSYSKDILPLLILVLAVVLPQNWLYEISLVSAMTIYAVNVRSYWILVAAGYLLFRLAMRFFRTNRKFFVALIFLHLVVIGFGIFLFTGESADYFRTSVNYHRLDGTDAASMIRPVFEGFEPLAGLLNVIITWFYFFIPIPLITIGSVYHTILFFLVGAIGLISMNSVFRLSHSTNELSRNMQRIIPLLLAFSLTQALFEPDFGSYLRHLTPLLPAVLMLIINSQKISTIKRCSQKEVNT